MLECGQAAGSRCFVQQLVLPGCMLEADAGVELLVPTLQKSLCMHGNRCRFLLAIAVEMTSAPSFGNP